LCRYLIENKRLAPYYLDSSLANLLSSPPFSGSQSENRLAYLLKR